MNLVKLEDRKEILKNTERLIRIYNVKMFYNSNKNIKHLETHQRKDVQVLYIGSGGNLEKSKINGELY